MFDSSTCPVKLARLAIIHLASTTGCLELINLKTAITGQGLAVRGQVQMVV